MKKKIKLMMFSVAFIGIFIIYLAIKYTLPKDVLICLIVGGVIIVGAILLLAMGKWTKAINPLLIIEMLIIVYSYTLIDVEYNLAEGIIAIFYVAMLAPIIQVFVLRYLENKELKQKG